MKRFIAILVLLHSVAFAQTPDTLTPESKARWLVGRIRDNTIRAITPADFRNAFNSVANLAVKRVPYLTQSELRAGKADTASVVQVINNNRLWFYRRDASSTAADDSATVLRNGNIRYVINADVITPTMFGAKGDGVADDTRPLNLALAFAKKSNRVVSAENKKYKITNTIKVDSVLLRDGTFIFASNRANIRLSNNSPELRDCIIKADFAPLSFYNEFGGAINLHLSTGAIIRNVTVTASVRRIAVNCISRATNTTIDGLIAKTAWGVLFNDLVPGSTNRIVDSVAYDNGSIGSGLTIQNSHFYGHVDDTQSGDAIEINVPAYRFSDVQIINNRIYKTVSTSNVGIGIGLAQVDNAVVAYNKLTNVASAAGALHCEWSTNVQFVGNSVKNSEVGGSFTTSQNVVVRDNYFDGCKQFGVKSQNTLSTKMLGLDIINNTFINGIGTNDIVAGNIERLTIQKNRFLGFGVANLTHLNFVLYNSVGSRNVKILDNDFINTTGFAPTALLTATTDCYEWQSKGNNFSTFGNPAASFIAAVSARGICEDFYRAGTTADLLKGSIYKVNGTPQGYITGSDKRIAEDISNGIRYRFDATGNAWGAPGASWSNPLNLGDAYIWKDATGRPRFKQSTGGAPTSDASGGILPVRSLAAPISATAPGSPGSVFWDDSFVYVYTGDGTTHSWVRAAVASW